MKHSTTLHWNVRNKTNFFSSSATKLPCYQFNLSHPAHNDPTDFISQMHWNISQEFMKHKDCWQSNNSDLPASLLSASRNYKGHFLLITSINTFKQNGNNFTDGFSNTFSWTNIEFPLKFSLSFFLGFQLIIRYHRFRLWLSTEQPTSYYLEQWRQNDTRPQWVNSSLTRLRWHRHCRWLRRK